MQGKCYNDVMNTLLMIYPIALIAVLLFGAKLYRTGEFNEDYLSLSQTKAIQAAAAIGVILHHVTQMVTDYGYSNRGPITAFANLGILFTAIFFFCSGFGLLTSYYSKENYLEDFLIHRLSSILIPFFVINILYVVYTCITSGRIIEGGKILRYIFGIYLINSNGWFIIEIFFLYLAFYILFRFLKNKDVALAVLCLFAFALIIWTKSRGHEDPVLNSKFNWFMGEWWYNSTVAFVMGLMFARFKEKITSFLKKKYTPLLIVTTILFAAFFVVEEAVRIRFGYYNPSDELDFIGNETLTCIVQNILCVISTFFVILLGLKIKIGNKALSFISFECTELFLCHGMFVSIFTEKMKINIFWKYALVIVCALILAFILAKLDKILLKSIGKIKKKHLI